MVPKESRFAVTSSVGTRATGPADGSAAAGRLGGRGLWTKPQLALLNDVASGQQGAGYASDGPNPDVGS